MREGMRTPALCSERLRLRPYRPDDEDSFVALFQDDHVVRYVGDGRQSEQDDRALFRRIFSKVYADDRFAVWAIEEDGRHVGHAELKPSPSDDVPGWELVYVLAHSAWGRGLGTEAASAIIEHGEKAGLDEVWATVDAANAASVRLLERLGFESAGRRDEPTGEVLILRRRSGR